MENKEKTREFSPAEMWGFAFRQMMCNVMVPNGWARIGPHSFARKSRINHLSEAMVDAVCGAAIDQHNHFMLKVALHYEQELKKAKAKVKELEESLFKLKWWQWKKIRNESELLQYYVGCEVSFQEAFDFLGKVMPDNVQVQKPKEDSAATDASPLHVAE